MLDMDNQLEEVIGNKLELVGPVIDSSLFKLGKTLRSRLSRYKATGLVNQVSLFFPWAIFRHLLTLCRGFSGEVNTTRDGRKHVVTLTQMNSFRRLNSLARFSGETFFAKRHLKKVLLKTGQKNKSVYNGKSTIIVSKSTPFCIEFVMKN